ncbi:preprotein translocase subunit YajC [Georgenia faecalis]|uniref:Preprotein translocase subunit YajC n=1 Tax=Georgenia faecalis TaxID=2483799 RepID=A0ABV9DE33_9MICO
MEFIIIIVLFIGMMWLMTRGQRKQQAAANEFRSSLEAGQNVMTHSGFYGRIVDIDGDVITLESTPGVETMWKRSAIAMLADPPFAVVEDEDADVLADDDVLEDPATAAPASGSTVAAVGTATVGPVTPAGPTPVVPDDASSLLDPPADGRRDEDGPRTPAS